MYLEDLWEKPPLEILTRQNKYSKIFSDKFSEIFSSDSKIKLNNNCSRLFNDMFTDHPHVHKGYYDDIHDNVLFVKDTITGKLIRKDESLLTMKGEFYHKDSLKILNSSNEYLIRDIKKYNKGDLSKEALEEKYKDTFIWYSPKALDKFNIDLFDCSISFGHLSLVVKEILLAEQEITKEKLLKIFLRKVKLIHSKLLDNSNLFIKTKTSSQEHYPVIMGLKVTDWERTDNLCVVLDNDYGGSYFCIDDGVPFNYEIIEMSGLPFKVALKKEVVFSTTPQKRKTRNNHGELLNYSAQVLEHKTPFMLTDTEFLLYKNLKDKKGKYTKPIFMGVELELVCRSSIDSSGSYRELLKTISDSNFGDHMIMKSDSSLHNSYSLEIVTVPATLNYHRKVFLEHFFNKNNEFKNKLMSNQYCGMHVHVSKNVLTELKWGQFMHFINCQENSNFIDAMCNREQNSYCLRDNIPRKTSKGVHIGAKIIAKACKNGMIKQKLARSSLHCDRRRAVNVNNSKTMEIRCFKATTDKNNFLRKLEFVDSLVHFVRNSSPQQMTVYDYVDYILKDTNKKEYPHLVRWLASKNFIGHTYTKIKDTNKLSHIYSKNLVPKPDTIFYKKKEN